MTEYKSSGDDGQQVTEALTGHENSVDGALLLLAEGKQTLSWSWDKTLRRWDRETGQQGGPRNC